MADQDKPTSGGRNARYIYRSDEVEDRLPYAGEGICTEANGANRGRRPSAQSGVVTGSGAGAGAGGNEEDYDDDAVNGSDPVPRPVVRRRKS